MTSIKMSQQPDTAKRKKVGPFAETTDQIFAQVSDLILKRAIKETVIAGWSVCLVDEFPDLPDEHPLKQITWSEERPIRPSINDCALAFAHWNDLRTAGVVELSSIFICCLTALAVHSDLNKKQTGVGTSGHFFYTKYSDDVFYFIITVGRDRRIARLTRPTSIALN